MTASLPPSALGGAYPTNQSIFAASGVRDAGNTITGYLDGVAGTPVTDNTTNNLATATNFDVAGENGGESPVMRYYGMAWYKGRILTASEIVQVRDAILAP